MRQEAPSSPLAGEAATIRTWAGPGQKWPRTAALGLLLLIVVVSAGCANGRGHIEAITVANPTGYRAMVELTGDDASGWLLLGPVGARSERRIGRVLDAGQQWTFRFTHPEYSEEFTIQRQALEQRDWRVEIPDSFGQRLNDFGVRESE